VAYEELRHASPEGASAAADEAIAWAGFAAARLASEFCQSWLNLQCRMVRGAVAGLLLLRDEDGSFGPAATWTASHGAEPGPHGADVSALAPVAERALRERRGAMARDAAGAAHVAYPVDVRGQLWGVVVVDAGPCPDAALQEVLRRLHWGAGWVETLFHRRQAEEDARRVATARLALEMVAVATSGRGAAAAAAGLASELAVRLECRRVAVGAIRGGRAKLVALSHAASVSARLRLSDSLAHVMEEAADHGGSVAYPPLPGAEDRCPAVAHRDHARDARLSSVASVVMMRLGQPTGVIVLERDVSEPFDAATLALCEAAAELVGPVIALQRELDRPVTGRAVRALGAGVRRLVGRGHSAAKLAAVGVVAAVAALTLATGEDRVSGKASIAGAVQRAAVAPFEGYVATAPRRAGDVVDEGEVLATLDTREIDLEALRYESQRDQARLKQQDAEGKHDRAQAAVFAANAAEADAQAALARGKSERARIVAPYRGLVVSGDLTQQLGAPVERGKVLFEIAPLDRYRVTVQVDERDLTRVRPGQRGRLVLNGLSASAMEFSVTRVMPVAVADDGRNTFRVEGALDRADPRLLPGMEGVGKIVAGRTHLIWSWTRPIVDWARLLAWKWLP
jgi:hypothetical protein